MKETTPKQARSKKDYAAPQLVEYGSLAVLTQGTGGTMNDGMSGMTMA